MKALFSKAKLGKLRYYLSLLLIMGCNVIYRSFLVVSYYDIGLFIVVTVVAVLYDKLIASKGFDAIVNPSLTPTFAYFLQSSYFPRFSYGLYVLQILFFLNGECFKFNLSYICFACFEGLLHWRISMFSPNGFFPFVVTSFWVLIRRTISVQ